MNTKLLEGYIGYTTYFESPLHCEDRDIIILHSGKWWKPNKVFKYPRGDEDNPSFQYQHAKAIVEEYFK